MCQHLSDMNSCVCRKNILNRPDKKLSVLNKSIASLCLPKKKRFLDLPDSGAPFSGEASCNLETAPRSVWKRTSDVFQTDFPMQLQLAEAKGC